MRHFCTPQSAAAVTIFLASYKCYCCLVFSCTGSVWLRIPPVCGIPHNPDSKKILNLGEYPQNSSGRRLSDTITCSWLPFLPNPLSLEPIDKRCEERQYVGLFDGSDGGQSAQIVVKEPLAKLKYMCIGDLMCAVTDGSTRLTNWTSGSCWNLVPLHGLIPRLSIIIHGIWVSPFAGPASPFARCTENTGHWWRNGGA